MDQARNAAWPSGMACSSQKALGPSRRGGVAMEDAKKFETTRVIGPFAYLLFLLRGPILVTLFMVVILVDFIIPGSMKEALRYALLDRALWHQFAVIVVALLLACAAVRFSGQAIIELVAPEYFDSPGSIGRLAHSVPRLLAFSVGLAVAWPLFLIIMDWNAFQSGLFEGSAAASASAGARYFAAAMAGLYVLIAFFVAVIAPGPHARALKTSVSTATTRIGLSLFPLALAGMFTAAVMGVSNPGIAYRALERYSSAVVGTVSDVRQPNAGNVLWRWVYGSGVPDQAERYRNYIERTDVAPDASSSGAVTRTYVSAKYSVPYVLAMLLSLLGACYAVRLTTAVFIDLLFPRLCKGRGRRLRNLLPPLASTGLGIAVALQFCFAYFLASPPVVLYGAELAAAWAIVAAYVGVGVLASLGSSSNYIDEGPWRESPSIGRRFVGAAHRLSSLDQFWHWFLRGLVFLGIVFFFLFANVRWVSIPQWIGPVGIILLWGATASAVIFILSFLAHATRIPFLAIIVVATLFFAGFNINDNHGLRILTGPQPAPGDIVKTGRTLELAKWIASRPDRDQYDHYPIFLIATEGGGIRAAYFTATVLAALQERCPAFALHTMAISGVSGGSLGASIFAGLAADDRAAHSKNPGCSLTGNRQAGPMVKKARQTLSTDLLSPLLGAMLFPDTLQRALPFPVGGFDRSRALEYAIENSWQSTSRVLGGDPGRLSSSALNLYTANNAVPNLLLNTTEAGKGDIVPYTTADILSPTSNGQAQIDDGNLDCGNPVDAGNCVMPLSRLKALAVSDDPDHPVALSTAAFISARFPYLTPAGTLLDPDGKNSGRYLDVSGGHYVDGGYFENSGTFLLSNILANLVGDQLCLLRGDSCIDVDVQNVDESALEAARNAVFIVIVIQSEPCTRHAFGTSCDEAKPVDSSTWSEAMSPLRALLSTRETRATYSGDTLRSMSKMIEDFRFPATSAASGGPASLLDDGIGCTQVVCIVTLRFLNRPNTDVPLTWLLSAGARRYMDHAVDGMERADVRTNIPRASVTDITDTADIDRVLGSYRRVLCVLAARKDVAGSPCVAHASVAAR